MLSPRASTVSLTGLGPKFRVSSGFTLLELVLVVVVVAILFSISVISLRGMTPKYRLRTAARELGSTIEQVRLAAISRGKWLGIHYVLDPPTDAEGSEPPPYYQIIAPPPDDFPDQPLDERELLDRHALPKAVHFREIVLAGNQTIDDGTIDVLFSPMGNAGSHIVVLEGEDDRVMSIKMNCITGLIDFIETGNAEFRHFED